MSAKYSSISNVCRITKQRKSLLLLPLLVFFSILFLTQFNEKFAYSGDYSFSTLTDYVTKPKADKHKRADTCPCRTNVTKDSTSKLFQDALQKNIDPEYNMLAWRSLAEHHPNLPLSHLKHTTKHCELLPNIVKIDWSGTHWQRLVLGNYKELLLYAAYYDDRPKTVPKGGVVRILALYKGSRPPDKYYYPTCHLWYDDQYEPVQSLVIRAEYVDWQKKSNDRYSTYLFTCPTNNQLEENQRNNRRSVPLAVSLVRSKCTEATNLLEVIGKSSKEVSHFPLQPEDFKNISSPSWRVGICGPALYYLEQDFSLRLIEWLEVVKLLGVSQVFLYRTQGMHPNIIKVLKYYEKEKFVTLTDFHYPPPYLDEPLLRRLWTLIERKKIFALENIYFTDCLLRNKDQYRFLAHFDPDEIPILVKHKTLPEFVSYLLKTETSRNTTLPASYKLRWKIFPNYEAPFSDGSETSQTNPKIDHLTIAQSNTTSNTSTDSRVNLSSEIKTSEDNKKISPRLPPYLHLLKYYRKFKKMPKKVNPNVKSIYDTHDATGAFSHDVIICAAGKCKRKVAVPDKIAYTGHFKMKCEKNCASETTAVDQVFRLREEAVPNIENVVKKLNLLS